MSHGNVQFNTVLAHELSHALLDHSAYQFLPSALNEALAETYAVVIAPEILNGELVVGLPESPRARTSRHFRFPLSFQTVSPDPPLLAAVWQDDPNRTCAHGGCQGRYDELSFYLGKFVAIASRKLEVEKHEIYFRITRRLYELAMELGSQPRQLRLEEIWFSLDAEFPGLTIDGLQPSVYFGTIATFTTLAAGQHFGVQAIGSWKNERFRLGPINPTHWQVSAMEIAERTLIELPPALVPVDTDTVVVELLNARNTSVELYEDVAVVKGYASGFIPNNLDYGLYRLRVRKGQTTVASTYFMQLPQEPSMNTALDGMYFWNIEKDGSINAASLEIPECTTILAIPGVTQAVCPPNVELIRFAGQDFDLLTDTVAVLRPFGSRLWPVLTSQPSSAGLSASEPEASLEVHNLNPDSSAKNWTAKLTLSSSVRDRNWLQLKKLENNSLELRAEPNTDDYLREGLICLSTGVTSFCADVTYDPRK